MIIIFICTYILGLTEGVTCENSIDLSPSNPFLESQYKHEECDMALQILQVCILKLKFFFIFNLLLVLCTIKIYFVFIVIEYNC